METVVVDVLEEKTGCGWFAEFDHDVARVQVCVDKVVEKEHVLITVKKPSKFIDGGNLLRRRPGR